MKERNKNQKGFIPIPLILGIIFILLLGGVGLNIIKTKEKISKAVVEIQNLEKEQNYSEAIEKLKKLEDSFLVKYFGFKREEIQDRIEKNKKLLEQVQKKTTITPTTTPIAEDKDEGKSEGKDEEKEKKEIQISYVDCQDDIDCLIEKAKTCTPAKSHGIISVKVGEYYPTILFVGEIRGKEQGKCVFYVQAEKLIKLEKEGLSPEEAEKEKETLRPFIEGAEEICLFNNEDLVKWLKTVKTGNLPSFDNAECKYHGLEIIKEVQ